MTFDFSRSQSRSPTRLMTLTWLIPMTLALRIYRRLRQTLLIHTSLAIWKMSWVNFWFYKWVKCRLDFRYSSLGRFIKCKAYGRPWWIFLFKKSLLNENHLLANVIALVYQKITTIERDLSIVLLAKIFVMDDHRLLWIIPALPSYQRWKQRSMWYICVFKCFVEAMLFVWMYNVE